ncbi:MAG: 30S ribosomal protein S8 [Candidatus Pacebacteria bacterium]|nr:30S ribosomal protein S8 [Candidatus Paceibacterota bacterium]
MDKISQLIINIKNAAAVNKTDLILSHSSLREAILNVLKKEKYIEDYKVLKGDGIKQRIRITLAYDEKGKSAITDLKRISKPSQRIYYGYKQILPIKYGHGLMILSSPSGIITDKQARKDKVGGEALFKIW